MTYSAKPSLAVVGADTKIQSSRFFEQLSHGREPLHSTQSASSERQSISDLL